MFKIITMFNKKLRSKTVIVIALCIALTTVIISSVYLIYRDKNLINIGNLNNSSVSNISRNSDSFSSVTVAKDKHLPIISPSPRVLSTPTLKLIVSLNPSVPAANNQAFTSSRKIIFGLGPEADVVRSSKLNQEATLGMYTSWFNGTGDLNWMQNWKNDIVPQTYSSGKSLHLVIFSDDPEAGNPCGRQYPISSQISTDMDKLAQIFAGKKNDPPLYVTLFTEFQTYPCIDNQWTGSEKYYAKLKSKMLEIRDIFHENAPNSKVSIGWGGWQSRWDDPSKGAGRSLFKYFEDVSQVMDFQSFQVMNNDSNINDVKAMTEILSKWGTVMIAHYKPDGFYPEVFETDLKAMMTDNFINDVTTKGLFAWSFMDEKEMNSSTTIYKTIKDAIIKYGTNL